eukprot:9979840-Alexandrium_andersonii.AAC.1
MTSLLVSERPQTQTSRKVSDWASSWASTMSAQRALVFFRTQVCRPSEHSDSADSVAHLRFSSPKMNPPRHGAHAARPSSQR